ncbi:hypothetical protein JNA71_20925 [Bacillus halotolerans]|nr:hypothetical protein [Bacillus halotolerans]
MPTAPDLFPAAAEQVRARRGNGYRIAAIPLAASGPAGSAKRCGHSN